MSTTNSMRHYCTLFDIGYLSRGLALYHSLISKSSKPIFVYILAMDEDCYRVLTKLSLKNVKVIHLENEFLNEELRVAKGNRSWAEFCWTSSSALIRHLLNQEKLDQVTYLDSDIYFFNDPEILFQELGDQDSALITDHFYFSKHDQSATSGKFCVQFLPFNNNENGRKVLERWYSQCIQDCSLSPERGICGDQKYLDEWPSLYSHVKISKQKGAGVAPWNVERFQFLMKSKQHFIRESGMDYPVIFYHFHGLKFFDSNRVELSGDRYQLNQLVLNMIYKPYFLELKKVTVDVARVNEGVNHAMRKDAHKSDSLLKKVFSFFRTNKNASALYADVFFQRCPICKSEDVGLEHERLYDDRYAYPGYFNLSRCRSCAHLFLQNHFKDSDFAELYTRYYPRAALSIADFAPHTLLGGIQGWFLGEKSSAFAWVPEKVRVLDVGCGFGQSVAYHAARGSVSVGIDADSNAKRVADHYRLDIRIGVFSPALFSNEKFDYITLDQVLEHSQDPVVFLQELKSLLTGNGRLLISIPNAFGFGAKIFGRRWIHWHTPYHLQFYSPASLQKLLNQVGGFEIEEIKHITHSHWIFYQFLALLTYPKMGERSAFWGSGTFSFFQKVIRKFLGLALKMGIFTAYTRLLDCIRMGDNRVIVLKKME